MNKKLGYNALMDEVCVGWGWCGSIINGEPSHVSQFIPNKGYVTADQFIDWLFQADGVDPHEDLAKWQKHIDGLRKVFIQHMGSDIVDVSQLK